MTEKLQPEKIARLLTQGTRRLNADTLSALSNARQIALQKQSLRAPVFTLATARWTHFLLPLSVQQWLPLALLAVMLAAGAGYWHHAHEQQIDELDVAILTDDLPIEVFVD
jgi:hypothetical protein